MVETGTGGSGCGLHYWCTRAQPAQNGKPKSFPLLKKGEKEQKKNCKGMEKHAEIVKTKAMCVCVCVGDKLTVFTLPV